MSVGKLGGDVRVYADDGDIRGHLAVTANGGVVSTLDNAGAVSAELPETSEEGPDGDASDALDSERVEDAEAVTPAE